MDYKIIRSESHTVLEKKVRSAMKEGWRPVGGIAIAAYDDGSQFFFEARVQ
ncbi:DUF1737 domain-containing protein [Jannaschia formosa]|uniref:DUF1737 domain-containing protein n=1 Tax=Jannaschia formosa TaxID=2259592 RepID=UPI000E1BC60B|nr:DUF1737 domain-containing protein [Jannaschia formosa]TFL19859.1 DUF1737 domain-containing protein [Jannaschia formosa]